MDSLLIIGFLVLTGGRANAFAGTGDRLCLHAAAAEVLLIVIEFEISDHFHQFLRLTAQATCRSGHLLHQRGILLRHLIHTAHCFTILVDTRSLFAASMAIIAHDMLEVDRVIAQRLDSGVPLVGQVSRYIIAAGGKRLRPALLLLCCGAMGFTGAQRFKMSAVVEFIHTATLLHDDVVDDSALRPRVRHQIQFSPVFDPSTLTKSST